MDFRFEIIYEYRELFIQGALMTLGISVVSIFFGTVLGLIGSFCRLAKDDNGSPLKKILLAILRWIALIYVTFFRGTPLFVQIFLWYFVWFAFLIHQDTGLILSGDSANEFRRNYGALSAGIIALSVNAGAYLTEIFRAGIQSIDKGQLEAAHSLGLSYRQSMRFVILPQAIRRMLPPFGNEFITLIKDSALVSVIGVLELAMAARTVTGHFTRYEEPYYTIAIIYLSITMLLALLFAKLEKRYQIDSR